MIRALDAPFDIEGHQVVVGVSVGIARAPIDGKDGVELLKVADIALYRAKADGRNMYRFFDCMARSRLGRHWSEICGEPCCRRNSSFTISRW